MNDKNVNQVIENKLYKPMGLISILEKIQSKYSYLPEKELREVSEKTGLSMVDIYGVATFYKSFSLKPRGKHLISVCLGTACHVRGGPSVAQELGKKLGINAGETTKDREFTMETVNCLGACALGPVVVVDGHYFPQVKASLVSDLLEKSRTGLDIVKVETDERIFPWGNEPVTCDLARYGDCGWFTVPVGQHPDGVSPYGVHDMAGNAWEWTLDWYQQDYYQHSPEENPQGPLEDTGWKSTRGGAWFYMAGLMTSVWRNHAPPTVAYSYVGFRCIVTP